MDNRQESRRTIDQMRISITTAMAVSLMIAVISATGYVVANASDIKNQIKILKESAANYKQEIKEIKNEQISQNLNQQLANREIKELRDKIDGIDKQISQLINLMERQIELQEKSGQKPP